MSMPGDQMSYDTARAKLAPGNAITRAAWLPQREKPRIVLSDDGTKTVLKTNSPRYGGHDYEAADSDKAQTDWVVVAA